MIKDLQDALNYAGASPALAVDGIFGPKTCAAAYAHRATTMSSDDPNLDGAYFMSLGLDAGYALEIGSGCASGFSTSRPKTPSATTQPKSKLPWLIGGGVALVIGFFLFRKKR